MKLWSKKQNKTAKKENWRHEETTQGTKKDITVGLDTKDDVPSGQETWPLALRLTGPTFGSGSPWVVKF